MNDSKPKEASGEAGVTDVDSLSFLDELHKILVHETLVKGSDRETKIIEYKSPEELMSSFDLTLGEHGVSREKLLEVFRTTIKYSVQTAHPRFFNQLYSGRSAESLASAWVLEALNTNVHTFDVSPVFSLVEQYVIKKVCEKIGYSDGDGVFLPGGSMCNFMGMHLARFSQNKSVKERGMKDAPRNIIFATCDAHYSTVKAAHFLGFGTDSVITVDTDENDQMLPDDLEKKIQEVKKQGEVPMLVVATCGSTVIGSFDPIDELTDVCHKHGTWLHVDASWGAGCLFSDKHRHLMKGVDKSDSVGISFHKMIGAQLQCSAIIVKHKGLLKQCNSTQSSYLYQADKHYDLSYDLGELTIQCGRKGDAFKLWAIWLSRGNIGMQQHVDKAFDNARYFTERIRDTEGFRLVLPKFPYLNISFWYIPPSLRNKEETPDWWQQVAKVAPEVKLRMVQSGALMLGYQPLESKGLVNFFRIIIENPMTTYQDLDLVLDEIHRLGKDL